MITFIRKAILTVTLGLSALFWSSYQEHQDGIELAPMERVARTVKLADWVLPQREIRGLAVNFPGWSDTEIKLPKAPPGYDGWRVRCTGSKLSGPSPVVIGPGAGFVQLVDATIGPGLSKAVSAGLEGAAAHAGDTLSLVNFTLGGSRGEGKWGIHTYAFDIYLKHGHVNLWGGEHSLYWHGASTHGAWIEDVSFDGAGAEEAKFTWRPWECPTWIENARIVVQDCKFSGWAKNAWGGGITLQGVSCDVEIRRCDFRGDDAKAGSIHAIAIDDGLSPSRTNKRYYDENGIPNGPGSAIGHILIEDCGIDGGPGQIVNMTDTLTATGPIPHTVARGVMVRRAGLFGEGAIVNLPERLVAKSVVLTGINTPTLVEYASRVGMDSEHLAAVRK